MNNQPVRRIYRGFLPLATIPFVLSVITPALALVVTLATDGFGSFSLGILVVGLAFAQAFRSMYQYPVKDIRLVSQKAWTRIQQWEPHLWQDRHILVAEHEKNSPSTSGLKNDIILSKGFVERMEEKTDPVDEAFLLHEFGHAINNDSRYVTILNTVMKTEMIAVVIIWILALLWNTPGILLRLATNSGDFILGWDYFWEVTGIPLGMTFSILLFMIPSFLAQRFIQRICEFGADAFVVDVQGTGSYLIRAIYRRQIVEIKKSPPVNQVGLDNELNFENKVDPEKGLIPIFGRLISTHPTYMERLKAISGIMEASSEKTASYALGVLILLWIAFVSRLHAEGVVNTIVLIGGLGLANFGVASVINSNNSMLKLMRLEASNIGLVFLGILSALALLVGYAYLMSILISFSGNSYSLFSIDYFSLEYIKENVPSLMKSTLTGLIWLWIYLVLNGHSIRDLLTWYNSPYLKESPRTVFALITILNFLVLTFVRFSFGTISTLSCLGNILCIPVLAIVFFRPWMLFNKFAAGARHICPSCKNMINGYYKVGMQCPHCSGQLNQWLFENKVGRKLEILYYAFYWFFTNEKVEKWVNSK